MSINIRIDHECVRKNYLKMIKQQMSDQLQNRTVEMDEEALSKKQNRIRQQRAIDILEKEKKKKH